jgi:hypothetical protein
VDVDDNSEAAQKGQISHLPQFRYYQNRKVFKDEDTKGPNPDDAKEKLRKFLP